MERPQPHTDDVVELAEALARRLPVRGVEVSIETQFSSEESVEPSMRRAWVKIGPLSKEQLRAFCRGTR